MIACLVPRHEVGRVWPSVAPHLAAALNRFGDYSAEDARERVEAGAWCLWIAAEPGRLLVAAVTEVATFPRRRVLFVQGLGGPDGRGAMALWPKVQIYARAMDCTELRFLGRRGWSRSRFIPPDWRHVADVVRVEV